MKTKVKTILITFLITFLLMSGLYSPSSSTAKGATGQTAQPHPFASTIWDDIAHSIRTIRIFPADMYDSVFSNSGLAIQ